jgi:hypothetical protein
MPSSRHDAHLAEHDRAIDIIDVLAQLDGDARYDATRSDHRRVSSLPLPQPGKTKDRSGHHLDARLLLGLGRGLRLRRKLQYSGVLTRD